MTEALEGLSVDAEMKALESVREYLAKISTESTLDRELGDDRLRKSLRSIRDEAREEAARRELDELKSRLSRPLSERNESEGAFPFAEAEVVPVTAS